MENIPEAVIVFTSTGRTVANDMRGEPLTIEEATALARDYSDSCDPLDRPGCKVFKLVPVDAVDLCVACGQPVGNVCWRCA